MPASTIYPLLNLSTPYFAGNVPNNPKNNASAIFGLNSNSFYYTKTNSNSSITLATINLNSLSSDVSYNIPSGTAFTNVPNSLSGSTSNTILYSTAYVTVYCLTNGIIVDENSMNVILSGGVTSSAAGWLAGYSSLNYSTFNTLFLSSINVNYNITFSFDYIYYMYQSSNYYFINNISPLPNNNFTTSMTYERIVFYKKNNLNLCGVVEIPYNCLPYYNLSVSAASDNYIFLLNNSVYNDNSSSYINGIPISNIMPIQIINNGSSLSTSGFNTNTSTPVYNNITISLSSIGTFSTTVNFDLNNYFDVNYISPGTVFYVGSKVTGDSINNDTFIISVPGGGSSSSALGRYYLSKNMGNSSATPNGTVYAIVINLIWHKNYNLLFCFTTTNLLCYSMDSTKGLTLSNTFVYPNNIYAVGATVTDINESSVQAPYVGINYIFLIDKSNFIYQIEITSFVLTNNFSLSINNTLTNLNTLHPLIQLYTSTYAEVPSDNKIPTTSGPSTFITAGNYLGFSFLLVDKVYYYIYKFTTKTSDLICTNALLY